jgi:uncharacterized membrane protein YphA (DoxX/SURF4 family)
VAFVVAAVTKLVDLRIWRQQARGLGAPSWIVPFVPPVELLAGALLVGQVARRPVAAAALVMLVAFSAVIVVNLRAGRRPPCACFGAWSARPIGWNSVARNLLLMVLAAVAVIG